MIPPPNVTLLLPSDWTPGISNTYDHMMIDYYMVEIYWNIAYGLTNILKDNRHFSHEQQLQQAYVSVDRFNDFCNIVEHIQVTVSNDLDDLSPEDMEPWFTEHAKFVQESPEASLIIEAMITYAFNVLIPAFMNLYRVYGYIPELIDVRVEQHYHIAEFGFTP